MENLFSSAEMAKGYAAARPAVHGLILAEVRRNLGEGAQAARALDAGCGSGLSTREPLSSGAACIGVEPAVSMLKLARGLLRGPYADFEGGLTLEAEFYARYMMTETNVAHAIRNGADSEIRSWVETALRPVFAGRPREVLFNGYWAVFEKPSSETTRPAP